MRRSLNRIAFLLIAFAIPRPNVRAQETIGTGGDTFQLRAYRGVRHSVEESGTGNNQVTIHRFVLDDAQHAQWFASKIYDDYTLTKGNVLAPMRTGLGPVDSHCGDERVSQLAISRGDGALGIVAV